MRPDLWPWLRDTLGDWAALPAYFSLLLIGFAIAIWLAARFARRERLDDVVMIDLGLVALASGVVGGRLLHVLADGYLMNYVNHCFDPAAVRWVMLEGECLGLGENWSWHAQDAACVPSQRDCIAWLAFWRGGLAFYGGLVVASCACVYFLKKKNFPVLRAMDLAGMTIPIGIFFGRLGCFLGGCCFGKRTDASWGLSFPGGSPASESQWKLGLIDHPHFESLPVHPTQLYESAGCLLIAALLIFWRWPRKRFNGELFLMFLWAYAVLRFAIEFLRDDDRGIYGLLSTSQWIGLIIAVACVSVYFLTRKPDAQATPPA